MGSDVRASDVRAQMSNAQKSNWLVRQAGLSLLSMSCLTAALVSLTSTATLSQTTLSQTPSATIAPVGNTPEVLMRSTLKSGSRGAEVTELQATLKLLGYYGGTVDGVYGQSTVAAVAQFQQAAGLNADGIAGQATWNRLFPATVTGGTATASSPAVNNASPLPAASGSASFPTPSGVSPPTPSGVTPANPRPALKPAGTAPKPSQSAETRPAAASPSTNSSITTALVALPVLRQGMKGSAVVSLQERLRSLGVFKGAADGVFGAETLAGVKTAQRRFKLEPDGIVGMGTWSALLR